MDMHYREFLTKHGLAAVSADLEITEHKATDGSTSRELEACFHVNDDRNNCVDIIVGYGPNDVAEFRQQLVLIREAADRIIRALDAPDVKAVIEEQATT